MGFKPGQRVIYMRQRFAMSSALIPATVVRVTGRGHYIIKQNDGRRVTVAGYSLRLPPTEGDAQ